MNNNINTIPQESEYHIFIGIDISKYNFVVGIFGSKKIATYDNDREGWQKFYIDNEVLLTGKTLIIMEVTGGYELELLLFLQERAINVHRADTRKVKNFIRSFGTVGKTDQIDAMSLAKYGYERCRELSLYCSVDSEQKRLKLLQERKLDLIKMLVQEKNRLQGPSTGTLEGSYQKIIKVLEEEIEELDEAMKKIIDGNESYKEKQQLLISIEGLGIKTANMLLSLVPELGKVDRKEIASLCGVAPHPKQSGTRSYYRCTIGGRRSLRPLLFMASMAASRSKGRLGKYYRSLIERGKKAMVAQVALMRKIIVIANAKLRDFYHNNLFA